MNPLKHPLNSYHTCFFIIFYCHLVVLKLLKNVKMVKEILLKKELLNSQDDLSKSDEQILNLVYSENIEGFSKKGLETFSKIVNRTLMKKYPKRDLYLNKKKGLSGSQFEKFLSLIPKERYKIIFLIMYKLGLRVSEAVKIRIYDIDFSNFEIIIHNDKCKRKEILLIPISLRKRIKQYVEKYKFEIVDREGYLFYKINRTNKYKHISKNYIRNYFRKISLECGFNKPRVQIRTQKGIRNLYEFGTHSFRRGFCNNFYALSNCPKKTQMVMRHKKITTTMDVYLELDKKEVFNLLENF